HITENPYFPKALDGHLVLITAILLVALGAVFLKGFKEAIGLAVFIVIVYLFFNLVVISRAVAEAFARPDALRAWWRAATVDSGGLGAALAASLLLFPKLALG